MKVFCERWGKFHERGGMFCERGRKFLWNCRKDFVPAETDVHILHCRTAACPSTKVFVKAEESFERERLCDTWAWGFCASKVWCADFAFLALQLGPLQKFLWKIRKVLWRKVFVKMQESFCLQSLMCRFCIVASQARPQWKFLWDFAAVFSLALLPLFQFFLLPSFTRFQENYVPKKIIKISEIVNQW